MKKNRFVYSAVLAVFAVVFVFSGIPSALAFGAPEAAFPVTDGSIFTMAKSGNILYIGGSFSQVGSESRNNIAAINLSSGQITSWNPDADGQVFSIVLKGSTIYVGGQFDNISGVARSRIAALDASTGSATSWNPASDGDIADIEISADGSIAYVAGGFTSIGGELRNNIAAIDTATGLATAWNPNADNFILSLDLNSAGAIIYAGGAFSNIGGGARGKIAALDISTGLATAWNPNANLPLYSVEISSDGSTVYAGGTFTSIGGQARNRIAALDVSTGNAISWNPSANNTVYSIFIDGSYVYVGGNFTNIGGQVRNNIAVLDVSTGNAGDWNPNPSGAVRVVLAGNEKIYAGGDFTSVGTSPNSYIAYFTYPLIQFSLSSSSAGENSGTANIEISLSKTISYDAKVDYSIIGGSASSGSDYTFVSGTAVIPAGSSSVNISVNITDDLDDESDETIQIALANSVNGFLGTNTSHTFSINDNEETPVSPAPSGGGGGGGGTVVIPSTALPEEGYNIIINSGDSETGVKEVVIIINSGKEIASIDGMRFSNFEDFRDSGVILPYAAQLNWTLSEGNGTKSVFARFYANGNQVSPTVSDSIILNQETGQTSGTSETAFAEAAAVEGGEVLGVAVFNFVKNLGYGMKNDNVAELQKRLIEEEVYSGPVTGYFGPLTLEGVKKYQAKMSIEQTGFVGPLTREALNQSEVAGESINLEAEQIREKIKELQAQLITLLQKLLELLREKL